MGDLSRRLAATALVLGTWLCASVPARANIVIDTLPLWDGGVTSGWEAVTQTFTATDSPLLNYTFAFDPREGRGERDLLDLALERLGTG